MNNRKTAIIAVTVLLLGVFFAAGLTAWGGDYVSWAAAAQQTESPTIAAQRQLVIDQQPAPVTEAQAQIAGLLPTQEALAALYDDIAASVVNIQVTGTGTALELPEIPGLPFDLPEGPEGELPPMQGQGSGFIYSADGHIVTNNHVVENATEITVYFDNGLWAAAEVVASDPQADLAVIKVTPPEGMELQPVRLAPADSLRVGYYVVAMGSPFGLSETMTLGIVSALGRGVPMGDAMSGTSYSLPDVIQTDTAINPGNSGGPLLNLNGEVVGVNFAINSTTRSNSGVGFAIPVSVIEKVVPALIEQGKFSYSFVGIAGQTVNAQVAEENSLPEGILGVFVGSVVDGGPAANAGIQAGDIVVSIDDEPVNAFEDLISYLFRATEPGQTVQLGVLRGEESLTLELTLQERPERTAPEASAPEAEVSIAEAIRVAKEAVAEAELMDNIESANAKQEDREGERVWIVTLTGGDQTATVVVDGQTGEVLELDVQ
jgi:2-alkenal reductase